MNKSFLVLFSKQELLVFLCVFAVMARACFVVLASPVIGYGNNFDFIRQSSCIGLWESYPDRPKIQAHPEGPVPTLVYDGDRRRYLCMASADNVFPYLAAHTHKKHAIVDLRQVGAWKLLLAALGCMLVLTRRMAPATRLALAAALFLSLGDFNVLSYLNTLYLDGSVAIALFLAAAAVMVVCVRDEAPRWGDCLVLGGALAWLGLAKDQYGGLAVLLGALAAAQIAWRWRRFAQAAFVLTVCVAAPAAFQALNDTPWGLVGAAREANRTDTFLNAVLPNAGNPDRALHILGLPASCRAAIGMDWYTPGLQAHYPCPALNTIGRAALLPLFMQQPRTFVVPLMLGTVRSQPLAVDDIVRFERPEQAGWLAVRAIRATSLSFWLSQLPRGAYGVLVGAAELCTACFLLPCLWRTRGAWGGALRGPMFCCGLGGVIVLYAVVSSVFGDGYQDIRRHALGLLIGLPFVLCGVVVASGVVLRRRLLPLCPSWDIRTDTKI